MKKVAIENDPRTKPLQGVFLLNVPKGFVQEMKKVRPKNNSGTKYEHS